MKILKKITLFLLVGIMSLSVVACEKKVDNSVEAKQALIKAIITGYDNDWLKASITKFNELYKDEGYSVKLELEDSDIGSVSEIMRKNKNDTDLYFDYGKTNQLVESSYSIMREDGVCLLEDLSDVLDSVALNDNKKAESSENMRAKFPKELLDKGQYTGLSVSKEKYPGTYSIPYATSTTGMYVNKKALAKLGYSMDDLLTTDALLDMCEEIVKDYDVNSDEYLNAFFPFAYAGLSAGGYPSYMIDYWLAQYMGEEDYLNFWNFIPKEGTMLENGYSVYSDYGILESLRAFADITNTDFVQPGYSSTHHLAAQGRVFVGTSNTNYERGSLMMVSGDWIYKESEKNYSEYLDDVIAIKAPIISTLGMKLGLCGSTHTVKVDDYTGRNEHCDACEQKLRAIVKLVDEFDYTQKTNAQIAQEVGVSESAVKHIREARGYIIGSVGECYAFIPSYCNAKKVAKLFLRHLFSNDWQKVFEEKTYCASLLDIDKESDVNQMNDRELSLYQKMNSYNTKTIYPNKTNKIRTAMGTDYPATSTNLGTYLGLIYSHKYSTPQLTPENVFKTNMEYVEISWYDYLSAAGY